MPQVPSRKSHELRDSLSAISYQHSNAEGEVKSKVNRTFMLRFIPSIWLASNALRHGTC